MHNVCCVQCKSVQLIESNKVWLHLREMERRSWCKSVYPASSLSMDVFFFAHIHLYLYLYLFLYLHQRPQTLVQAPLELLQVLLDVGGYADDDDTECELPLWKLVFGPQLTNRPDTLSAPNPPG